MRIRIKGETDKNKKTDRIKSFEENLSPYIRDPF